MTDLEREEFRQHNGRTILDLCAIGSAVLAAHGFPIPCHEIEELTLITNEAERLALRDALEQSLAELERCEDKSCPVIGLHNTDECEDLIRQAKEEER